MTHSAFAAGTSTHPIVYTEKAAMVQPLDWNEAWTVQQISNDTVSGDASVGWAKTIISRDSAYTLKLTEDVILCDTAGGDFVITLPSANELIGKTYWIKNQGANTVVVEGAERIDNELIQGVSQDSTMAITAGKDMWSII